MADEKILVIDDEKEIADLIEIYLIDGGYQVAKAYDAREGLDLLNGSEDIKLVLLDIMLPGTDGFEVCRKIREKVNIPIIFLSARSDETDKITGLDCGADDYVTKPFSPPELMARVKSALRRYTLLNPLWENGQDSDKICVGGLAIDKNTHRVWVYDKEVKLTSREFDIIWLLASRPGRVFSTNEIFEEVWRASPYEADNVVMVHIRRMRIKLGDDKRDKKVITTVWGVGYKIEE